MTAYLLDSATFGALDAADILSGTLPAACMPSLTGDVTSGLGSVLTTISANAVTNAKAAQMPALTIKGNATVGTANAADLTVLPTACMPPLTGDITNPAGNLATTITASAVTNAKRANMAAYTLSGNNTSSSAAPSDLSIAYLSVGGADPTSIPFQIAPFKFQFSVAASYADSTNNIFNLSSYVRNTGTGAAVGVFGEGVGDGANSSVWGGNFVGYANSSTAVGRAIELDFGSLVAGGDAYGNLIVHSGTQDVAGNYTQFNNNSASKAPLNGIVFNASNPLIRAAGTLIKAQGTQTAANGIDLSAFTFTSTAFKSPSFNVDGSGNITAPSLGGSTNVDLKPSGTTGFLRIASSGISGQVALGESSGGFVRFTSHVLPNADNAWDLGASGLGWSQLYVTGASVFFSGAATTASAANAFLDNGTSPVNQLKRSTSSIRYKREVEDLAPDSSDTVLKLRPVWYRSRAEGDRQDWSWYGLIAEEVAEIDPRLVHWSYPDSDRELVISEDDPNKKEVALKKDAKLVPDSVMYDRLTVFLIAKLQSMQPEIDSLRARLANAGL